MKGLHISVVTAIIYLLLVSEARRVITTGIVPRYYARGEGRIYYN